MFRVFGEVVVVGFWFCLGLLGVLVGAFGFWAVVVVGFGFFGSLGFLGVVVVGFWVVGFFKGVWWCFLGLFGSWWGLRPPPSQEKAPTRHPLEKKPKSRTNPKKPKKRKNPKKNPKPGFSRN